MGHTRPYCSDLLRTDEEPGDGPSRTSHGYVEAEHNMEHGVVVLGAGIAGISAAWHAAQHGVAAVVYEARDRFGGLLDNFTIDGTLFDNGVHYSFTNSPYVRQLFDSTPYYTHFPEVYNYERGRWLKHPVQNNLYPLSVEDKVAAIESFLERGVDGEQHGTVPRPANYYEWLVQQYGSYIANRYPVIYTRKYWTVDANNLSTDWIGSRMNRPALRDILLGVMTDDTPHAYYVKEMRYPERGGYLSFIESMAREVDIRTGKRVVGINARHKVVSFADGQSVHYERLISSLPLPEVVRMLEEVPAAVKEAAQTLWATSVALVSVGIGVPNVVNCPWFYIYDEEILAARAYAPHCKSPHNVRAGTSALQYEVYFSRHKPLPMSSDSLAQHMAAKTIEMGLAQQKDILFADVRVLPYANVVFDVGMTERRDFVLAYLRDVGIWPIGRFGEWNYFWSDQSLLSGKKAADRLCGENSC